MGISTVVALVVVLLAASTEALAINWNFLRRDVAKRQTGSHFLFLFGDSYTRVEFNNKKAAPSAANPIGNPAFPGDTTTGGLNWPVMLGSKYNTSLTLMYDYGYGGAVINETIVKPPNNAPVNDLNDQVNLFKLNFTKSNVNWAEPHRSLFAFWFGQNDVYQSWNRSYSDPSWRFNAALDGYFTRMDELYQLGARDFLWIGVAPILRTPLVQSSTPTNQTAIVNLCTLFNSGLSSRATTFASTHKDITWRYYDPAPAFNRVLNNPSKYGLVNSSCQSSKGTTCPWWDHFHPAIRIHEQIAADIAGNATYPVLFTKTSA